MRNLVDTLVEILPKIGGWPNGCVAISLFGRGNVWAHSKMPTRYRDFLGVWTDDSFWGNTTKGFSKPLFYLGIFGNAFIPPVTKAEYESVMKLKILEKSNERDSTLYVGWCAGNDGVWKGWVGHS